MRKQVGSWGQTIFTIRSGGGTTANLELMQRRGTVILSMVEICAIAGLADALGFDYKQYSGVMKKRLEREGK